MSAGRKKGAGFMATRHRHYCESDRVTKQDFSELQSATKSELAELRRETATKSDLAELRNALDKIVDKIEARHKSDRDAAEARLAEERKESRASRRALNANFAAQVTLIVTVVGLIFAIINNGLPI